MLHLVHHQNFLKESNLKRELYCFAFQRSVLFYVIRSKQCWGPSDKRLRVNVCKDHRYRGHSSKFDFAHTSYIGRPKYCTYEIGVYLIRYYFL